MKILRSIAAAVIMTISMTGTLRAAAPTVSEIMKNMEALEDLGQDITVQANLTQQKPDEGVSVIESVYYRRDQDDAFLIVMTAPDKEKGNGYLRVGENMWMYRRNTRTFQIMGRDQKIAGTDARAGDMEKRKFTELYEPVLDVEGNEVLTEEMLGKAQIPVYRLEVNAKVKDVEYPKVIYWVRRDNFLTLKQESYSLSGTLMKTTYTPKWTTVAGKYIPLQRIFIDEFEKGNKTILDLSGISLVPIDDFIFTKAYLESINK